MGQPGKTFYIAAYIVLFVIISLIIAPLINETLIAITLNLYACQFSQAFSFDFVRGFHVITNPLCELEEGQRLFLSVIGPACNSLIAFILFAANIAAKRWNRKELSLLFTVSFLGFLSFPILLMLSGEGELYEAFRLGGIESLQWQLPVIGSILLALSIIYFWLRIREFFSGKP